MTADDVSAAPETIDEAEVVVVGGGPAGASCAALLAERGHDVLIVDQERFPRDKPCGDGLTRSAVAFCERLGLGELMEEAHPVMGLRVVLDHRSYEYREYAPTPRRPQRARCIPRRTLDEALLQAALARGARFRHARVTGSARTNGLVRTDTLVDNRPAALRSRFVVAADGATSRLRRTAGHGRIDDDTMAYAVRAYFRCEQALEPVFEAYVPLDFDGQGIAGYGWLFPIDAHTANIGVGYWRGGGLRSPTNMRAVLDAFVEQLMLRGRRRFGELERTSKPFGSPLGVHFRRERCEHDGIVFLGDAARTTDPLTGEGITYALHGAERVAELIHARAEARGTDSDAGSLLGRRFPRLEQDVSSISRLMERRVNRVGRHSDNRGDQPFVRSLQRVVSAPEDDPDLLDTPAGEIASRDEGLAALLEEVNTVILDTVSTGFPLAGELLHREVRSRSGPVLAFGVLASGAGAPRRRQVVAGAAALELFKAGVRPLRETVDRPRGAAARANNAMSVLISDFALVRAVCQAVEAGGGLVGELTVLLRDVSNGQLAESQRLFDSSRTADEYLRVVHARAAAPLSVAAGFGARAAGHPPDVVDAVTDAAREVGLALQICDDVCDVFDDDEASGRGRGSELRLGAYALPVIDAQARDPILRRMLLRGVDSDDVAEVGDRTLAAGGLDRALGVASDAIERAAAQLDGRDTAVAAPLLELSELVLARTRAIAEGRPEAALV